MKRYKHTTRVFSWALIAIAMALLLNVTHVRAEEDKSSTREGLVKMPAASGTVNSEKGSFSIDHARGAAGFTLPLPELPTRGGMGPGIALRYGMYNGDEGKGFGIGWSLSVASFIRNQDYGTPYIGFPQAEYSYLYGISYEGKRISYKGKSADGNEIYFLLEASSSPEKITYFKTEKSVEILGSHGESIAVSIPSGFEVTHPDGGREYYTADLSIAEGFVHGGYENVTRWPLVLRVNPRKEGVQYHYEKDHDGRSYLKEVVFAGGASKYELTLIDSGSEQKSYSAGHEQSNSKLYAKLEATFDNTLYEAWCFAYIGRQGSLRAADDCYREAESDLSEEVSRPSIDMLDRLTKIYRYGESTVLEDHGALQANRLYLPSIEVEYSSWMRQANRNEYVYALGNNADELPFIERDKYEIADINGDALVDIIVYDEGVGNMAWLGSADLKDAFKDEMVWSLKNVYNQDEQSLKISDQKNHFADMNGDGYVDLVRIDDDGQLYFWMGNGDGQFKKSKNGFRMSSLSDDNFGKGGYRFVDLNGDGKSDIIGHSPYFSNGQGLFEVILNWTTSNNGEDKFQFVRKYRYLPKNFAEVNLFSKPRFKMTDVNGDGRPDLVEITEDGFCLYENIQNPYYSYYIFGDETLNDPVCEHGKHIVVENVSDLEDSWFIDVNSDGIIDLVTLGEADDQILVLFGLGNGDYAETLYSIALNMALGINQGDSNKSRSRVADVDGDGQQELMVFRAGHGGKNPVVIVDFNRIAKDRQLVKTGLLTAVAYDTGVRYDLRYSTSINEIHRDLKNMLPSDSVHFPVTVVKQLVTTETLVSDGVQDGWRTDTDVVEMLYHNPVYDPLDKRLLGFQEIETITYGDEDLGEKRSQESFYSREVYYVDSSATGRHLAGSLKSKEVHRYSPVADSTFALEQSRRSFDPSESYSHSLLEYAREQDLPQYGYLLQREENDLDVVLHPEAHADYRSYYVRQLGSRKTIYAGQSDLETGRSSQTLYEEFDDFNMPHRIVQTAESMKYPYGDVLIPEKTAVSEYHYDTARDQLHALEIVNLPDTVIQKGAFGSAEPFKLGSTVTQYDSATGNAKSTEVTVFSSVDPSLQGVSTGFPYSQIVKTHYYYDEFGNTVEVWDELGGEPQLLEKVSYDPRGLFPLASENALGHRTEIYYSGIDDVAALDAPVDYTIPIAAGWVMGAKSPAGMTLFFEYDALGRKVRYLTPLGQEKRFAYRDAYQGKPQMILTSTRRHFGSSEDVDLGPEWIETLDVYSPLGVELAHLENAEEDGRVRVMSWKSFNRQKKPVFLYVPFEWETTLAEVFASGDIVQATASETFSGETAGTKYRYDGIGRVVRTESSTGLISEYEYALWGVRKTDTYQVPVDDLWNQIRYTPLSTQNTGSVENDYLVENENPIDEDAREQQDTQDVDEEVEKQGPNLATGNQISAVVIPPSPVQNVVLRNQFAGMQALPISSESNMSEVMTQTRLEMAIPAAQYAKESRQNLIPPQSSAESAVKARIETRGYSTVENDEDAEAVVPRNYVYEARIAFTDTVGEGENIWGVRDEEGHLHKFERNILGTLSSILLAGEPNPRVLRYNTRGQLEYQRVPGVGTWYHSYDQRGRAVLTERYDSNGTLIAAVSRYYDILDRLAQVEVEKFDDEESSGAVVATSYTYDEWPDGHGPVGDLVEPMGMMTSSTQRDPNRLFDVTVLQGYSLSALPNSQEVIIGENTYTEELEHNLDGSVKQMTDAYGVVSRYSLTRSMRLNGVQMELPWNPGVTEEILKTVEYNAKGQPEFFEYRGGAQTYLDYNEQTLFLENITTTFLSTPEHLVERGVGALQNLDMHFDSRGAVTAIDDNVGQTDWGHVDRTGRFHYNLRNELVLANRYGEAHSYRFNPAGAMLFSSEFDDEVLSATTGAPGNATTLIPKGSVNKTRNFDSAGRLYSSDKLAETEFDAFGRLVRVRTNPQETDDGESIPAKTVYYGYDATGRRVYRQIVTEDGLEEKTVLFPTKNTVEEETGRQSFVMVGSYRAARVDHGNPGDAQDGNRKWYYYLKDHLTSSDIMMSPDGYPVEQMLYRSYGTELKPEEESTNWADFLDSLPQGELQLEKTHHRFTGHYLDDDTGLYYMNARYYDPEMGRFISPDPEFIAKPALCAERVRECNLYAYAANNPMLYVDPTGKLVVVFSKLKLEIAVGPGVQGNLGYAFEFHNGEMNVYQFGSYNFTAGIRLDGGADLTIASTDTYEDYRNTNWLTGSIDSGLWGIGVGYGWNDTKGERKHELLITGSFGIGAGGSFTLPGTGNIKYKKLEKTEEEKKLIYNKHLRPKVEKMINEMKATKDPELIKTRQELVKMNNRYKDSKIEPAKTEEKRNKNENTSQTTPPVSRYWQPAN